MADPKSSTPVKSLAVTAPVVVSRDLNQNAIANPIYVQMTDGVDVISITGTSLDVNITTANVDIRDLTHVSDSVKVGDGTDFWSITALGYGQVDIAAQSVGSVAVSKNNTVNSETNPLFVEVVEGGVSSNEVLDYNTVADVAADASSNHDYTVTATKTLVVRRIHVAASGAAKWEVRSGPVASLATKSVKFTTAAWPSAEFDFEGRLEVPDTSTGTLRVIRTNRDNQAQDMYSTVIGNEV